MHRVGIESDQLVYDYLSRVGDLAQRQQLTSGARMRLVSDLRGEIDRQRGAEGADSPAAVRRIIGRLGSPDELVAAAARSGDGPAPSRQEPSVPQAAFDEPGAGRVGGRRPVPRPRSGLPRKDPKTGSGRGASRPARGGGDGGADGGAYTGADKAGGRVAEPGAGSGADRTRVVGGGRGGAPRKGGSGAGLFGAAAAAGGFFLGRRGNGRSGAAGDSRTGAGPAAGRGDADPSRTGPGGGFGASAGGASAGSASAADAPRPFPDWPDPSAPHVIGLDRSGGGPGEDDWWRLEPGPFDEGAGVGGFVGGIEAPELLGRPAGRRAPGRDAQAEDGGPDGPDQEPEGTGAGVEKAGGVPAPRRGPRLPRLRRRRPAAAAEPVAVAAAAAAAPAPRRGLGHPLPLLAAALLVAGVVTGSWLPLAGGWLIAYGSRTLSRTEAKWAALGLPGVVAAGAVVWVWGRLEGRWGEPVRDGALGEELAGAWPVVVRVAAVASALYLVWRARRRA
ncbi:hypothetical protein ACIP6P_09955 [Streptomyces sp. NPDC088729]|uniref:hypothetical protein n=1 Tax=Streptomyces sp. NPDC088729 TaxID=3365876 RepID=UPI003805B48E